VVKGDDREAARQALDDLKERGRAPRRSGKAPPSPDQLARQRAVRLRRSITAWATLRWWLVLIVLAIPTPSLIGVVTGDSPPAAVFYLAPVGLLVCAFGVAGLAHLYSDRKVRSERAWARALPFELAGYPDLLGDAPGADTTYLEVRLEFADRAPPDLAEILRGFDPELGEGGGWFVRERPAEVGRVLPFDLNRKVRWWVRRFVPEVLAPLHAAHRLRRVELRLVVPGSSG